MATPIPILVGSFRPDATVYGVRVGAGTTQAFDVSYWYFLVSPKTSAGDRQSALRMLKNALDSGGAAVWTVGLDSSFRLTLSHTAIGAQEVTFREWNGVTDVASTAHARLWGSNSGTITIDPATTWTASYQVRWVWSPDRPVGITGPERFDPTLHYGIPVGSGNVDQSPDGTVVGVDDGTLYVAEYEFRAVQGLHKILPDDSYRNSDLSGWWTRVAKASYRILWWRDRTDIVNSDAPSGGSSPVYDCIEYAPQQGLVTTFPAKAVSAGNKAYWNIRFPLLLTEQADAIPS